MGLLFLPHRLLGGLVPEGLRWRELVVLGQLAWLLWPGLTPHGKPQPHA
jgi:hypothetical protein